MGPGNRTRVLRPGASSLACVPSFSTCPLCLTRKVLGHGSAELLELVWLFSAALGIKPGALHILSNHSMPEPHPSRLGQILLSQVSVTLSFFCRHIFFLHIKESLLAGHLQCSPEQAVELSALLAQTKFGDYNQNTAKYNYEDLCEKELSSSTLNR